MVLWLFWCFTSLSRISDQNNPLEGYLSLTWIQTPVRLCLYSRSMLLRPGCLIHSALGSPLEDCANMFVHCCFIRLFLLCFQITSSFQILRVQSKYCLWALRPGFMAAIFSCKSGAACLSWPSRLLLQGETRPSKRQLTPAENGCLK